PPRPRPERTCPCCIRRSRTASYLSLVQSSASQSLPLPALPPSDWSASKNRVSCLLISIRMFAAAKGPPLYEVPVNFCKRHTIGNFNPCSFAHSTAISYPASACRITPVPGSFHNTRAIRLSASAVPSHTITTPECCEYPIPTPPP